jgi:hypothetical protein
MAPFVGNVNIDMEEDVGQGRQFFCYRNRGRNAQD